MNQAVVFKGNRMLNDSDKAIIETHIASTNSSIGILKWPTSLTDGLKKFQDDFLDCFFAVKDGEVIHDLFVIKNKRLFVQINPQRFDPEQLTKAIIEKKYSEFINEWITSLIADPEDFKQFDPSRKKEEYCVKINLNGHVGQIYPIATPGEQDGILTAEFVFIEWN